MSRVIASARRLRLHRGPLSPLPAAFRLRGTLSVSVPTTSVCAATRQRSTLSFARALSSSPAPSYSLDDVVSWLDAELALDVSALRVTGLLDGAVGDYFVFATARSRVHMRRVAKGVRHELKERGVATALGAAPGIEGADSDEWMLVDGGHAVVSVLTAEARDKFALERKWLERGAVAVAVAPTRASAAAPPLTAEDLPAAAAAAAAAADAGVYDEVDDDFELLDRRNAQQRAAADGAELRPPDADADADDDGEDDEDGEYYEDEYYEEELDDDEYDDESYDFDEYEEYYEDEYGGGDDDPIEGWEEPPRRPVEP